ncbi:hypothetical protein D3C76_163610 [compost metagenome]
MIGGEIQYLRKCNLIFANEAGEGLDVSMLRIVFAIKRTDGQTPNTANIRVYGLNRDTRNKIQTEYTNVLLQAGYEQNYGVIFTGTAKKIIKGKESNTDPYLEVQAADGDTAYNFSTVNTTISAGASQRDQIDQIIKVMKNKGVTQGSVEVDDTQKLPRAKVMYGMSRNYMRQSSASGGSSWTIQNGVLQVVPLTGVLPDQAVVLNSGSGLVGRPEQTNTGIKFRCLLNPFILVGGAVQINEADIQEAELDDTPDTTGKKKEEKPVTIEADGLYRVITLNLTGDTRGNDWYCEGECLDIDATVEKKKSVQVN